MHVIMHIGHQLCFALQSLQWAAVFKHAARARLGLPSNIDMPLMQSSSTDVVTKACQIAA